MKKILANNTSLYLFFLILSLLFYGNSIKNGFNFDDSYVTVTNYPVKGQKFIPNNPLVAQGISGIPKIWRSRYGHGYGMSYDYRPVVISLFAIEFSVFGQAPHINHFISIVLYALVCFYLFILLKLCLHQYPYKESFALVCALLFLAHPIHTEVVNNIKCTDELLALLFGLLSAIHIIKYYTLKHTKYLIFSIVFILLAFYSKSTSILFIVLIPTTLYFFFKIGKKQFIFIFLALFAVFLIHNLIKNILITEKHVRLLYHFENPLFTERVSFFAKTVFALKSLGLYIKLLFFPYPLRFYYGYAMISTDSSIVDLEIILAVACILAAGYYCYKLKNKIAFFGLLFFIISIGPIINFVQPVAGIIGERLCFTASIGFVMAVVAVIFSFYKTPPTQVSHKLFTKKPILFLSPVLLLFLFYTWNRNSIWKDELTLFEHDIPFLKKSAAANNLLANKYFEMLSSPSPKYGQSVLMDKCMYHYNLVMNADSSVYTAFNNTGVIVFLYLNKAEEALNYFRTAVRVNPNYPQAYENMANCYNKLGRPGEALGYYQKAISQNVTQQTSYVQVIKILMKQKRYRAVTNMLEISDNYFRNDFELTKLKGDYYFANKQYAEAVSKYEVAYAIRKTKDLTFTLFNVYSILKDSLKADYFNSQYKRFR